VGGFPPPLADVPLDGFPQPGAWKQSNDHLNKALSARVNMLKEVQVCRPSTLNPQPSTLIPQPSTLNPQPSTLDFAHSEGGPLQEKFHVLAATIGRRLLLSQMPLPSQTLSLLLFLSLSLSFSLSLSLFLSLSLSPSLSLSEPVPARARTPRRVQRSAIRDHHTQLIELFPVQILPLW